MIDVVMTIHNPREVSTLCLESFRQHKKGIGKFIIVDNNSTEPDYLSPFYLMADQVVTINKQVSIGESWNLGITESTAPYVLITNDDIMFSPDWLAPLEDALNKDTKIGILQPFNTLSALPENFPQNYHKSSLVGPVPKNNFIGCCFVIRKDILPVIKRFDQTHFPKDADSYTYFYPQFYPFGPEDQDFYRRVQLSGYSIRTHHNSYVHHFTGETMKQIPNFEELKVQSQTVFDERWKEWDITRPLWMTGE